MAPQEILTLLFEHAHESVVLLQRDGVVVSWSHGAESLYGYGAGQAVGRSVDFLSIPNGGGLLDDWEPSSGRPLSTIQRHRRLNGEEIVVDLRAVALDVDDGKVLLFARLADTERNDLEGRHREIEAARREAARLARRLLVEREEERRRLGRELHDDVSQRLVSFAVAAQALTRRVDGDVATDAENLAERMDTLARDVRGLSRNLHPAAIERFGLAAALEAYALELQGSLKLDVRWTVREDNDDPLAMDVAIGLYRIAQEALGNVARHSGVRQAHLSLVVNDDEARLAVADSGVGFDTDQRQHGLGLASMEERVRLLGGRLRIASSPGTGTEIEAVLPRWDLKDRAESPAEGTGGSTVEGEPDLLVGPYRLLEVLGQGASGTVYLAEEPPPLGRRVAVKLHRMPFARRRETLSFKAERQALARLRHPAVAQIYEARTTEAGHPYIVMEHVAGLPVDEYCDRYRLSLERRLEIFIAICEGVQHAHQKGILHRDLKPANILVGEEDGRPQPKIIDFGGAKGLDQPLAEGTLWTEAGVGTPAYMSPEALAGGDVDTRSDLYSLALVLYQLLVGDLPFEVRDDLVGMLRALEEGEGLPRPSQRFAALDAERARVAATARETSPEVLRRSLRGDLDWILWKALARRPSERYSSAAALARDLERHLRYQPVDARGSSKRGKRTARDD